MTYLPQFDTRRGRARLHRKQRLAAVVPAVRPLRLRRGRRRPHHGPRPRAPRPLLGQPVRHELQPHPGLRPDPRQRQGRGRRGRRTPVNGAAFAIHSQIHAARPDVIAAAHSHSVLRQVVVDARPPPRPAHPGRLRVLRGPRPVRRLHRRRARPRGGQAHRPRARRQQGGDPAQPRPAHRRALGRRGGVVVHHDGALVPGPAAWPRRRARRCTSTPTWRASPRRRSARTSPGYFSFQPLYEKIVREQPDLFE